MSLPGQSGLIWLVDISAAHIVNTVFDVCVLFYLYPWSLHICVLLNLSVHFFAGLLLYTTAEQVLQAEYFVKRV